MRTRLSTDRGVAGLTILLSLVTMLFVIGLLVMIFALMGGELQTATFDTESVTVTNETTTGVNQTGYVLDGYSQHPSTFANPSITGGWYTNASNWVYAVPSANFSVSSVGLVQNTTSAWTFANGNLTLTYTYEFGGNNTATDVINDTTSGISSVTDWYPIFIVIGAMVVLILLTVIIITAIRGSGLMAQGSG